jgi:hypothetical protein
MNEDRRKQWNADRLAELYPSFRDKISAVVIELDSHGFRPRIHEAWRSEEDQLKAFKAKFSQLKYGFHNVTAADGTKEALAVDMVDENIVNNIEADYSNTEFLLRLTAAAQKQGLDSGIRWGLQKLQPEAIAEVAIAAINNAIANEDWKAILEHLGWDPAHIQPQDITPEEARIGKRPL